MKKVFFILLISFNLFLTYSCSDKEGDIDTSSSMTELEAVIPSPDILNEPYGVCAHITRNETDYPYIDGILDLMDDLHITWVRSDMDWNAVSYGPGKMDYTFFDEMFTHIDKHPNIKLLPIIVPRNSRYETNDEEMAAKKYYSDWKEYVKGVISRYHTKCPVWEGFNEWDAYLKFKVITYKEGLNFQKDIYDIAKGCDSNLQVIEGSISNIDPYYENLSMLGFYNYTDYLNKHTYSTYSPEDNFVIESTQYSELFQRFKFERPAWVTEFGYSTADGYRTEEEQAYLIIRAFISGFARGNSKMFLYSLRSKEVAGHLDDKESHFGIVHKDLSPKPAYYSLRNLTRMLPSGSSRPKLYNKGLIYLATWTHTELGKVYAIWTKENPIKVKLKIQGNAHFYSYSDIETELNIKDYDTVEIGPGIIYVVGATSLSF